MDSGEIPKRVPFEIIKSREIIMVGVLFTIMDPYHNPGSAPVNICMGSNLSMVIRQELIGTQLFVTRSEFSIDQNQILSITVKC